MASVVSIGATRRRARTRARTQSVTARITVLLLVPVALLLVVGLGALMSASSVVSFTETGDGLYYFKRQLVWAGFGIIGLAVASRVPYGLYARLAVPLLLASVASLVAVRQFGVIAGGSRRWIDVGPLTVQPSEFAKFTVVVFLAMIMAKREDSMARFADFMWPVVMSLGVVGVLVLSQPDMGTVIIIASGAFAVLMASRAPLGYVMGTAMTAAAAGMALAAVEPYRWQRVTAFMDPFADSLDTGFQAVQSMVALGTGGIFGVGLGLSRARWEFLPNAHTDFIFAIVGEETGFAGGLVVLVLFTIFTIAGTVIALRAEDRFGRLLAIGIVAWLSIQALVNIGGVIALLPITGVPLPFMSFGGNALLINMITVGVLVNIAKSAKPR
ncbi:MAG: putative lipid II flippase FtsW [Acidimicrobiia bacterium]|nr:putative lipid II flippase FtsW [Acidimicrobiia bacterium]